ncbi:MAG: putative PEP-binding protein [Acidimicrobiales bacterium]
MTAGLRGAALVRDVVRRADDPTDPMTTIDAVERVTPSDVELILHPQGEPGSARVVAVGIGASPGVASGQAVFDAGRALDRSDDGHPIILVRPTTGPDDAAALAGAAGVVTSTGGMASHAAVLARGRGLPAVCGAHSLRIGADSLTTTDGVVVREGDVVSIDGGTGEVRVGAIEPDVGDVPVELDALLGWADEVRAGSMGVWANADTAADAGRARRFGAEGLGLCRVEHLLLGHGLDVVRRVVGADDAADREAALDELAGRLRADLVSMLEVMDGLPVTVRLLDLPLDQVADGSSERNPMLGVRGVRLAVLRPSLYRAQVQALAGATIDRLEAGGHPIIRLMVPFVSTLTELVLARELVESVLAELDRPLDVRIGAMVETPRAALRCAELAAASHFLSFGTNDLTQMTFGFSRDDVGPVLDRYRGQGLLPADPFETIDLDGVGELVATGVERARIVDPAIEISVCGEHGGDPASIAYFRSLGIDHVSCSPFRVPLARLAAARAVLGLAS